MSAFLGFGTALPEYAATPERSLAALSRIWPRLRAAGAHEVVSRHTAEPLERVLEPRSFDDRMRAYALHAPRLARRAACQALRASRVHPAEIDLVISVSCTGYLVPSLDVQLQREIGLRPDVIRLPLTELGCSGGAAAIAAAHRHLAGFPNDHVLIVAVEVCSLSFHPDDRSIDNLTAALVFGDGAAAAVMTGEAHAPGDALRVVATAERLLPESEHLLGFELRSDGFRIVLDRGLSRLIQAGLAGVVDHFERLHEGPPRRDFVAVHAGGPRIFDAVEAGLGLRPDALATSREVFRRVGNLSSASILYSLSELPADTHGDGLAIAFGPGVTVAMAQLSRA